MRRLKIGLNGFGRIGRSFTRIALKRDTFDLVAINTRKTPNSMLAYLLQYDSVYHKFEMKVKEELMVFPLMEKKFTPPKFLNRKISLGRNIKLMWLLMPLVLLPKKLIYKNI